MEKMGDQIFIQVFILMDIIMMERVDKISHFNLLRRRRIRYKNVRMIQHYKSQSITNPLSHNSYKTIKLSLLNQSITYHKIFKTLEIKTSSS